MFCFRPFCVWLALAVPTGVLLTSSVPAEAQSKGTLKRAQRALDGDDPERLRDAFQELSDGLRDADDATAMGWWLRGETAARLAEEASRPVTMATVALDSFNEALNREPLTPAVDGIARVETLLRPRASASATTSSADRYAAAELLMIASEIRKRVAANGGEPVDPVALARVRATAIKAALSDRQVRVARKLFLDLDAEGGFIEPLALTVAEQLEEVAGPQQAFLFLNQLVARHAHRRKLLIAYVELCAANGWYDEARQGLDGAMSRMRDTYEDHLFLATNFALLDRLEVAESYYKQALEEAPKGFEANSGYAVLLMRMADEAVARAEDPEDPSSPERLLAITLRRRAVAALETALAANPDHVPSLQRLLEVYTALEDPSAIETVQAKLAEKAD